jgi:hypothetical protein
MFEWAKTDHALDRAATVIGSQEMQVAYITFFHHQYQEV